MSRSSDTRLRSRHTHFAPRPLPRGVLVVFRAEAACFFFAAADTFNITGSAGAELPSTRICDDDSGVPAILSSVYVMYGRCNETSTHQHSVARPTSPSPTSSSHCYHQILVSLSSFCAWVLASFSVLNLVYDLMQAVQRMTERCGERY